jgi:hypothetical protein
MARSTAVGVRKGSVSRGLACRGYGGKAVAEVVGDPTSNDDCGIDSQAIWPGKMTVSSRRGREIEWCRGESDGEFAAMSTFTAPIGDLPTTCGLSGKGNGATPWGKVSAARGE